MNVYALLVFLVVCVAACGGSRGAPPPEPARRLPSTNASAPAPSASATAASSAVPAPAAPSALATPLTPEEQATSAIVWFERGPAYESVWLDGETEVARRPSVVIATDRGLFEWQTATKKRTLAPRCGAPTDAADEVASLVHLGTRDAPVVVNDGYARGSFPLAASAYSNVTVRATLGPWVFYNTFSSFSLCGDERPTIAFGHGTWNVDEAREVALVADADVPADLRARAVDQCDCFAFASLDVAFFRPRPVEVNALFSNGAVRNYQLAAIPWPASPPPIAPYAKVPAGVVRWRQRHPDPAVNVAGMSVVSKHELLEAFSAPRR